MKIIFAPDSFKGALPAPEAARALARGWRSRRPDDLLIEIPLADGGEGTCRAVIESAKGTFFTVPAHDPLMRKITAQCGATAEYAVMELAGASGIELLKTEELSALNATTYGTGEVMRFLLDKGYRRFLLGIGGSATVDGGAGMLQALGCRFFSEKGELPPGIGGGALHEIIRIDCSALDARLKECTVEVACDVTNPLTGPNGAAAVFAPQKGATPEQVKILDGNLKHWAELHGDQGTSPGDGAAGGVGFMLRKVLGGVMRSGARFVIEAAGLPAHLNGADLVITGEGCSDSQTAQGKLCAVVAGYAARAGVPAVLCSGALRGDCSALDPLFAACFSIARGPGNLDAAIAATEENLFRMGANLAGIIRKER